MRKLTALFITAAGSVAIYEYLRKIGVTDQINGKVKSAIGSVTKDRSLEVEGLFDTGKGKTKEFLHDAKTTAEEVLDDIKDDFE